MTGCVVSSIVKADKAFQIQFALLKEPPPCSTVRPHHLGDAGVGVSCVEAWCLAERRGWDGKTALHLATATDSCFFCFKCKTYIWGPGCLGLWSPLMCCPSWDQIWPWWKCMIWGALPQRGYLMLPGDAVPPLGSDERVCAKTRSEGEAGAEQREARGYQSEMAGRRGSGV